jgi:type III secretion system low calcium response chaperone LcrH/SycD
MTEFARQVASLLQKKAEEGFSPQQQERLYALGYQYYNQARYVDAVDCFTKLTLCNPFVQPYWCALASSQQMQALYTDALHAWGVAVLLQEKNPLPHFHAAECYFSLQEFAEALKALQCAETLLTKNAEDQALLTKISALKEVYNDHSCCTC